MKRLYVLLALIAGLLLTAAVPVTAAKSEQGPKDRTPVTIQFLNFSDWHGQLEPVSGVGGAAYLSTYFQRDRSEHPNTLTLTAGDAYGATPPISNFFDEEPAVRALRMMGLDVDTFGNHNFDRGVEHLQRMIDIANAPAGTEPGEPFQYVSANLANRDANLSGVEDWHIFDVGGVKVGVVGITNPEAPELVSPGGLGTIEITDPVRAANKARAEMKKAGAQVFVAIAHMGVRGFVNGQPYGELIDFAENVGGYDFIFGDHTNVEWAGVVGKALVSMNLSKGATYSRTVFEVDPVNGRIISRDIDFVRPVTAGVTPDPAIQAMIDELKAELAPILGTVIGGSTRMIPRADACGRGDGRLCESLVGNVTTDAMRTTYGVDFAITNSGGLRDSLTCPTAGGGGGFCPAFTPPPWLITRGQVLSVLPFGNVAATLAVDGALLKQFLENGVSSMPGANGRFAQVSGLCFTYDVTAPAGARVTSAVRQAADGTCTGGPLDLTSASTYSLAINDFMATGGDGYPNVFDRIVTRDIMDQVLAGYVAANSPLNPTIQGRITCTGTGCPTVTP